MLVDGTIPTRIRFAADLDDAGQVLDELACVAIAISHENPDTKFRA